MGDALQETACDHCPEPVSLDGTARVFDGTTALYYCQRCNRWTRGPPP